MGALVSPGHSLDVMLAFPMCNFWAKPEIENLTAIRDSSFATRPNNMNFRRNLRARSVGPEVAGALPAAGEALLITSSIRQRI
jgi:hypothetical protein